MRGHAGAGPIHSRVLYRIYLNLLFPFSYMIFHKVMSPRIAHLILDFDETLTRKDTIELLASAAYRLRPPHLPPLPPWRHFVDAYMEDYNAHVAARPKSQRKSIKDEFDFLDSLLPVERASIRRIEAAGIFQGLRFDTIAAEAAKTVELRPGVMELCAAALRGGVKVQVLSVNWSQAWIRGALKQGEVPPVFSNELETDAEGVTTGWILRVMGDDEGIWTAGHKERWLRENTHGRRVYVGDSATDLRCLLTAEVGVVVGDRLDEVCERIGVPLVKGLEEVDEERSGQKPLYKVEDLEEVERWIETYLA
jgi:phosphoserine phosphatase